MASTAFPTTTTTTTTTTTAAAVIQKHRRYRRRLCFPLIGRIEHRTTFSNLPLSQPPPTPPTKTTEVQPLGRKRERPICIDLDETEPQPHNITDQKRCVNGDNSALVTAGDPRVGFFFVPSNHKGPTTTTKNDTDTTEATAISCHLLVIPHTLLQIACDAVRFEYIVSITSASHPTKHSDDPNNNNRDVLELHIGALRLLHPSSPSPLLSHVEIYQNNQKSIPPSTQSNLLTLERVQEEEQRTLQQHTSTNHNNKPNDKRLTRYAFTATIDAVSPIFHGTTKSDPFVLVELYHEHQQHHLLPSTSFSSSLSSPSSPSNHHPIPDIVFTATIVLKGHHAVSCQSGLHPGDRLVLKSGLRRQKWHVPTSLNKKKKKKKGGVVVIGGDRAPTHVFVVTDPKSIVWGDDTTVAVGGNGIERDVTNDGDDGNDKDGNGGHKLRIPPPLPTVVHPLTAFDGKILGLRRPPSFSSRGVALRYLLLEPCPLPSLQSFSSNTLSSSSPSSSWTNKTKTIKLYVEYYPMSTDLLVGLRPGAYLRAVNIHRLYSPESKVTEGDNGTVIEEKQNIYGACLRSTLALLRCAGENEGKRDCSSFDNNAGKEKQQQCPLLNRCRSYRLCDIDLTYDEMERASFMRREWQRRDGGSNGPTVDTTITAAFESAAVRVSRYRSNEPPGWVNEDDDNDNVKIKKRDRSGGTNGCRSKCRRLTGRDPYEEFYDHACEESLENDEEEEKKEGCYSPVGCWFTKGNNDPFPTVFPPHSIRNACLHHIRQTLERRFDLDGDNNNEERTAMGPKIGWVASIRLHGDRLMHVLDVRSPTVVPVCTAGIVGATTEGGWAITKLDDRKRRCRVSCAPVLSSPSDLVRYPTDAVPNDPIWRRYDVDSFVVVEVYAVVVSCLYLGRRWASSVEGTTDTSNDGDGTGCISNLPPLPSEHGTGWKGSTAVLCVRDRVYIASVQIVYRGERGGGSGSSRPSGDRWWCGTDGGGEKRNGMGDRQRRLVGIEQFLSGGHPSSLPELASECHDGPNQVDERRLTPPTSSPSSPNIRPSPPSFPMDYLVGCLARVRWKVRKSCPNGRYSGCMLTLSHVRVPPDIREEEKECIEGEWQKRRTDRVGPFQTIELNLDIPVASPPSYNRLNLCTGEGDNSNSNNGGTRDGGNNDEWRSIASKTIVGRYHLHSDIAPMAAAWWRMAEDGRNSSSLICGWEEEEDDATSLSSFRFDRPNGGVFVTFPTSACTISKAGYTHFRCEGDSIEAHYIGDVWGRRGGGVWNIKTIVKSSNHILPPTVNSKLVFTPSFTHVGGEKKLPGTIAPRRTLLHSLPNHTSHQHNVLSATDLLTGVMPTSIGGIHSDVLCAIAQGSSHPTKPSLVRALLGACMVHVSFCRARAECTRCFRFLIADREVGFGGATAGVIGGGDEILGGNTVEMGKDVTNLFCSSGCHIRHAAIKWECSGPISDSTGQAKLYSERATSLALLGEGLDIAAVERGAWHHPSGITFTRTVPPRSEVDAAFFEARKVLAAKRWKAGGIQKTTTEIADEDILQSLPVRVRAEFELERFCRSLYEPLRKLDLFVRCKPLSSSSSPSSPSSSPLSKGGIVDHAEVPMVSVRVNEGGYESSKQPTFRLPPLKLSLVECFRSRGRAADLGWDMVRALRSNM